MLHSSGADRLRTWLAAHEARIHRFRDPVPLTAVADETGLAVAEIRDALRSQPVHHVWSSSHRGVSKPRKPYVLRENGPGTVGLDHEDSIVGAAEAEFRRRGYQTARELGTPDDLELLVECPDLTRLTPGLNQRDLWALRANGRSVDLWIVEAKGKEDPGFDLYTVAEALGQLFPIREQPLSQLLGAPRTAGHGLCLHFARTLRTAWKALGLETTITLGLLLPYAAPDVVWRSPDVARTETPLYIRPVTALQAFLDGGEPDLTARTKGKRAFATILRDLEHDHGIRALARGTGPLRFRTLLASPTVQGIPAS